MSDGYEFTTDWFSGAAPFWSALIKERKPSRFLEIGSYEGRSSCFLIDEAASRWPIELHCVDSWKGGLEHDRSAMSAVEARFDSNIARARAKARHPVRFHKHKALSTLALSKLIASGGSGYFDLIYVDGSHQAPDVLADAVLAFALLRVGGLLIFDDYLWSVPGSTEHDFYQLPKPAIDAFVNIYQRKLSVMQAYLYQLYVEKVAA